MGAVGRARRWRSRGIVFPLGLLLFAAFAYFSVWGWLSVGPAREFETERCAADAPMSASCRTDGAATVTGTSKRTMNAGRGVVYGITYIGQGRIPDGSATYISGDGASPLPAKNQLIDVTTWQGKPVYLRFDGTTVTVAMPPDRDTAMVALFADISAFGAVCVALVGRPLPSNRRMLPVLRFIDWVWLPGLVAGYLLVSARHCLPGFAVIDVAGASAFLVSEALRLRTPVSDSRLRP